MKVLCTSKGHSRQNITQGFKMKTLVMDMCIAVFCVKK